jgi:hypothetical protein
MGLAAFSPFVSSRFREAGEAVCGDAVHAPREVFSTVARLTGPESDGLALGPGAEACFTFAQ